MPAAVHLPYHLRNAGDRTANAVSMVGDLALRHRHELDTGAYPDIDVIEANVLRQGKNRKGTGTLAHNQARALEAHQRQFQQDGIQHDKDGYYQMQKLGIRER